MSVLTRNFNTLRNNLIIIIINVKLTNLRLKLVKQTHKDMLRYWWITEFQIIIARINLWDSVKLQDWQNYVISIMHAIFLRTTNIYTYICMYAWKLSYGPGSIFCSYKKKKIEWEVRGLSCLEFCMSRYLAETY